MKRAKTPTFLLELPLRVDWSQERHVRAHLEAARCLYNALLAEANEAAQADAQRSGMGTGARYPSRAQTGTSTGIFCICARSITFRNTSCMSMPKVPAVSWIADHIESTMAQTLATRAYQAVNRVCVGKAKRVRFRSHGQRD